MEINGSGMKVFQPFPAAGRHALPEAPDIFDRTQSRHALRASGTSLYPYLRLSLRPPVRMVFEDSPP
jgi:hypothetical protein